MIEISEQAMIHEIRRTLYWQSEAEGQAEQFYAQMMGWA